MGHALGPLPEGATRRDSLVQHHLQLAHRPLPDGYGCDDHDAHPQPRRAPLQRDAEQ